MKNDVGLSQGIPPKYELAGRWQLSVKVSAQAAMSAGIAVLFGLSLILGVVVRGLLRPSWEEQISFGGLSFLPFILGVIVAIVIHEAVHGLGFLVAGANPRFGVKLTGRFFPVAYATSKSFITRNQYLLVGLAPFIMVTLVFLVTGILANTGGVVVFALSAMAANVGGSFVDLMVAWKIRQHDIRTLFRDTEDGFIWCVPSNNS